MAETLESLYDEEGEDDLLQQSVNDLIPSDFIDPNIQDIDDFVDGDDDEFTSDDDLLAKAGNEDDNKDTDNTTNTDEDDPIVIVENPVINELLAAKGIKDAKVQYETETGEIEELDFYSLPYEDQLEILKSDVRDEAPGFSEHELQVVDFLRAQNTSFDDVIAYAQRQAVEDYIRENNGEGFVVDDYEDKELYLMDLKVKYDDWTEEELAQELEKELQHEELFKKKIDKIRQEYVALEIQDKEDKEKAAKATEDEKFEKLSNSLIQTAVATEDIGGLKLEDNDKNAVLSTLLEKDLNEKSKFIKSLEDPQILFQAAWYIEKGKEAFDMLHTYYKNQIDEVRKTAFTNGKASVTAKAKPAGGKVSFTRTQTKQTNGKAATSIEDLFD